LAWWLVVRPYSYRLAWRGKAKDLGDSNGQACWCAAASLRASRAAIEMA